MARILIHDSPQFLAVVREWLSTRVRHGVQEVLSVSSYGSDMAGDTECGFYAMFEVVIRYRDVDGSRCDVTVDGEALTLLWAHVVQAVSS